MRLSDSWLRTFVNPPLAARELADVLSMSGLDVEGVEPERDDWLFTFKPTANRGDCLSIFGLAREVAAVTGAVLNPPDSRAVRSSIADRMGVTLEAQRACPRYCGRLVRDVKAGA